MLYAGFFSLLQYIRWMTCFWLQFTHNVSFHTIRLSSKESCLKINVKNGPTFAGCHLATHPKSGSCGSKGIRLLIFLLFVLETSQYPSGLRLEEVTLFVRLDGEHPSSSHRISRLNLPHVNEIKNLIVNPGFAGASFRVRDLILALVLACLSAGSHSAFQHVSGSTINSSRNFNFHITEIVGPFIEVQ